MLKKKQKDEGDKGGGQEEEEQLVYLQDKLQKEESNTAENLLKLNDSWRSILCQTRVAELHHEVTVIRETFERHLDSLDRVIKNLERDLQDPHSARARHVHLHNLERLRAHQDKRIKVLQRQWDAVLEGLTSRFRCERKQILADSEQIKKAASVDELEHEAVMSETEWLYKDMIMSCESLFHYRMSDLTPKSKEILQKQEDEKLCNKQVKKLDELMAENKQLVERTNAEMKRANKLQDSAIRLRDKLNFDRTKNRSVEQDLTVGSNLVKQQICELRKQRIQDETSARKRLSDLTAQSDQATKKLQATIDKGKRIIRVAEMCHKLKSEQMTVLSTLVQTEEGRLERTGRETEEPAKEVLEFPELQELTQGINNAVLQREALKKHRNNMSQENHLLRVQLRQQLDAITVTDDAFNGQYPLLTVQPTPTTATRPASNRQHTIIEAAHIPHIR